jgi:antitoxin component YwqK of YwqJK toxin-antitoxin module
MFKKIILPLVFLSLTVASSAVEKIALTGKAIPQPDGSLNIIFYKNGTKTGREVRPTSIAGKAQYIGTIPDGVYRVSFHNSRGYSIVNIAKGKRNGISKSFFADGKVSEECFFQDGLASGICRGWHEDGSPAFAAVYKNGVQDGKIRNYYASGKPHTVNVFSDGHPVGESLEYYPSGKLKRKAQYSRDGKLLSSVSYAEDGKAQ